MEFKAGPCDSFREGGSLLLSCSAKTPRPQKNGSSNGSKNVRISLRLQSGLIMAWRVPAGSYPFASDHDSDPVIQLKCDDRRPAAGCGSDNACPIFAPPKVFSPPLSTRIEEIDQSPASRIATLRSSCFEPVAEPAREPEVVLVVGPTSGFRNEMVDLEHAEHQMLRAQAVPTAIVGLLSDTCAHLFRNLVGAHGLSGSRSPRPTASRIAWALRRSPDW